MYFIFPENLPASVQKATFELTSNIDPSYCFITPEMDISNKGVSIAIPDLASHIRSIRFVSIASKFTYYYPDRGYAISQGIHLPDITAPAVGDYYAGGIVIQTGTGRSEPDVEPDIQPFKGTVMAIHEKTLNYQDALTYCEAISVGSLNYWHLPDMMNLAQIYNKQLKFNMLLMPLQGTMLYDEEYWCKDNSVIDLGVAFNMATGELGICSKQDNRQARAMLDY